MDACGCRCPGPRCPPPWPHSDEKEPLLRTLAETIGITPELVLQIVAARMGARLMDDEIERLAEELGVPLRPASDPTQAE
jgi:hypothetical protein